MKLWHRIKNKIRPSGLSDWEAWWNARASALESVFGQPYERVWHAVIPFHLGGGADVVAFCNYVPGWAYVTSELVGETRQLENSLGAYELMICTREQEDWAPNLISRLAKYTLEAVLEPGQTMDIGSALPEGSTIEALVFTEPDVPSNALTARARCFGVLLCIGITRSELEYSWSAGHEALLNRLRTASVFPFTDLKRPSVV